MFEQRLTGSEGERQAAIWAGGPEWELEGALDVTQECGKESRVAGGERSSRFHRKQRGSKRKMHQQIWVGGWTPRRRACGQCKEGIRDQGGGRIERKSRNRRK